jgi:signal peptidase I
MAVICLAVAVRAARVRRVQVHGDSMRPALEAGDRLVAIRPLPPSRRGVRSAVSLDRPLRVGDVVVVRDPRAGGRHGALLVKRVWRTEAGGVDVRGDDPARSTDSRVFGLVPWDRVVGRAVYRYAPPGRGGWIR